MKHLFFKLKCIELILNTASFTKADIPYWESERKEILQNILKLQLLEFKR